VTEQTPPLEYPGVGGTRDGRVPQGFHGLSRATVAGRAAFGRLTDALLRWDVHRGAGLTVEADGPVAVGREVRLFLAGPLRPLPPTIACRVVYLVDEPGRRGFAYGTLPGRLGGAPGATRAGRHPGLPARRPADRASVVGAALTPPAGR